MQGLKWRSSKCLVVRGGVSTLWLRVTDVVWSSECEGVRQRQSLTQPVSPQTGFPLLGQLASSSQSHTKCFDSLFSTQRNCPVLTTDVAASGPLTKESADFPIDFLCKEGAVRGVCVHWLTDWWKCWLDLLHIDTIEVFLVKSPADPLQSPGSAPQLQGETTIRLGVSCHGKLAGRNEKIAQSTPHSTLMYY